VSGPVALKKRALSPTLLIVPTMAEHL